VDLDEDSGSGDACDTGDDASSGSLLGPRAQARPAP